MQPDKSALLSLKRVINSSNSTHFRESQVSLKDPPGPRTTRAGR